MPQRNTFVMDNFRGSPSNHRIIMPNNYIFVLFPQFKRLSHSFVKLQLCGVVSTHLANFPSIILHVMHPPMSDHIASKGHPIPDHTASMGHSITDHTRRLE